MFYADRFCTYIEDAKNYYFKGPCHVCRKTITVAIPTDALYNYNQGINIENAMPTVSAADREFLMTGYCGDCFKAIANAPEY